MVEGARFGRSCIGGVTETRGGIMASRCGCWLAMMLSRILAELYFVFCGVEGAKSDRWFGPAPWGFYTVIREMEKTVIGLNGVASAFGDADHVIGESW